MAAARRSPAAITQNQALAAPDHSFASPISARTLPTVTPNERSDEPTIRSSDLIRSWKLPSFRRMASLRLLRRRAGHRAVTVARRDLAGEILGDPFVRRRVGMEIDVRDGVSGAVRVDVGDDPGDRN